MIHFRASGGLFRARGDKGAKEEGDGDGRGKAEDGDEDGEEEELWPFRRRAGTRSGLRLRVGLRSAVTGSEGR